MRDPLTPILLGLSIIAVWALILWVPSVVAWLADRWLWGKHE